MRGGSAPGAGLLAALLPALGLALGTTDPLVHAASPPRPPRAVDTAPYDRRALAEIVGAALLSERAHQDLRELCDGVGARLSGTPALRAAIGWAADKMRAAGLRDVHTEKVMVPVWVRGAERGEIVSPVVEGAGTRPLSLLGLGGTVGTPAPGVEGEVAVVSSFAQLGALGEAGVRGRIVLYDVPFTTYGETVKYRGLGPSAAARLGAVAALVRSVTPVSHDTPHTGNLSYQPDAPKIPAAAVTVEDAQLLARLAERGPVRVRLTLGANQRPDEESANLVGEIPGRERPDEVVLVGAHLDSWDVGQGAQDDGAGVVMALETGRLIAGLPERPRRTVRVVLYTNEENGLRGGKGYRDAHRGDRAKVLFALEADLGSGPALGFTFDARTSEHAEWQERPDAAPPPEVQALWQRTGERLSRIASPLAPLGAARVRQGHAGSDIDPLLSDGTIGLGLDLDSTHYWDVHHSRADTFEKVSRDDLRRDAAVLAAMTWLLAESL